jgi:hypothetical protein
MLAPDYGWSDGAVVVRVLAVWAGKHGHSRGVGVMTSWTAKTRARRGRRGRGSGESQDATLGSRMQCSAIPKTVKTKARGVGSRRGDGRACLVSGGRFELVRIRHTKKGSGLARESRQRMAAQHGTAAHGGRSEGGRREEEEEEEEKDGGLERKKCLDVEKRLPLVRRRYGFGLVRVWIGSSRVRWVEDASNPAAVVRSSGPRRPGWRALGA